MDQDTNYDPLLADEDGSEGPGSKNVPDGSIDVVFDEDENVDGIMAKVSAAASEAAASSFSKKEMTLARREFEKHCLYLDARLGFRLKKILGVTELDFNNDLVLNKLEPPELNLLTQKETAHMPEEVFEKILYRNFHVINDVIDEQPVAVRMYMSNEILGAGGVADVKVGYAGLWDEGAVMEKIPKLQKTAVKKQKPEHKNNPTVEASMQREIDTLRTVRKRGLKGENVDGLLNPLFVGKDREGEMLIMTGIIKPHSGAESADLGSAISHLLPGDALSAVSEAMKGLETLHRLNLIHLDIKLGNIFAGSVEGENVGQLGDLGTVSLQQFLRLEMEKPFFSDPFRGYVTFGLERFPDKTTMAFPLTHISAAYGYKHFRAAQEWMRANPGKPVPEGVKALPDAGQTAYLLSEIQDLYGKPGVLPANIADLIQTVLRRLIERINDVPDFDDLNTKIEDAQKSGDNVALKKAKADKQKALETLSGITAEQIGLELASIADYIGTAGNTPDVALEETPTANIPERAKAVTRPGQQL